MRTINIYIRDEDVVNIINEKDKKDVVEDDTAACAENSSEESDEESDNSFYGFIDDRIKNESDDEEEEQRDIEIKIDMDNEKHVKSYKKYLYALESLIELSAMTPESSEWGINPDRIFYNVRLRPFEMEYVYTCNDRVSINDYEYFAKKYDEYENKEKEGYTRYDDRYADDIKESLFPLLKREEESGGSFNQHITSYKPASIELFIELLYILHKIGYRNDTLERSMNRYILEKKRSVISGDMIKLNYNILIYTDIDFRYVYDAVSYKVYRERFDDKLFPLKTYDDYKSLIKLCTHLYIPLITHEIGKKVNNKELVDAYDLTVSMFDSIKIFNAKINIGYRRALGIKSNDIPDYFTCYNTVSEYDIKKGIYKKEDIPICQQVYGKLGVHSEMLRNSCIEYFDTVNAWENWRNDNSTPVYAKIRCDKTNELLKDMRDAINELTEQK